MDRKINKHFGFEGKKWAFYYFRIIQIQFFEYSKDFLNGFRHILFATIDHFFASMFPNLMDSWIQKDWIFQLSVLKRYPSEQQLNWISFQPMIVSDYKVKLQFFQLWIIKKNFFQLVIETIDWIGKSTNSLVSKRKNELFITFWLCI